MHIDEEALELYALKRPVESLDAIEEHLLICESCRQHLDFLDDWCRSVRVALASGWPERSPEARQRTDNHVFTFWNVTGDE